MDATTTEGVRIKVLRNAKDEEIGRFVADDTDQRFVLFEVVEGKPHVACMVGGTPTEPEVGMLPFDDEASDDNIIYVDEGFCRDLLLHVLSHDIGNFAARLI